MKKLVLMGLILAVIFVAGCVNGNCENASFDLKKFPDAGTYCLDIYDGKYHQVSIAVENATVVKDFKIEATFDDGTVKLADTKVDLALSGGKYFLKGQIDYDRDKKIVSAKIIPTSCSELAREVVCS